MHIRNKNPRFNYNSIFMRVFAAYLLTHIYRRDKRKDSLYHCDGEEKCLSKGEDVLRVVKYNFGFRLIETP